MFLDYDGTLVPFAEQPHLAHPDAELLQLLERLCGRADTTVHIITGRSRGSIDAWLGHLPIGLHAEHGQWSRGPLAVDWSMRSPHRHDWVADARILMNAAVVAVPGSMIEQKESGIAWHYRLADRDVALDGRAFLEAALQPFCERHGLEVLAGVKVIEVRQRGVHKGHVVREVVSELSGDSLVVAIGDDVTDDDMFAALPPGAFAIAAAPRPVAAHFRVDGHRAVRCFLQQLCEDATSRTRLRGFELETDAT